MKAISINEPGEVDVLQLIETPTPSIADDEVLVEVKAISINPIDIKSRSGKGLYSRLAEEDPLILGWDISGVVADIGKHVKDFSKDDAVFGMVNFPGHGKAYAEYVAVPVSQLALKPNNISYEEAAAATLAALTAWQALVKNAKLKEGDKVLIHAASGGVGHFAVQIAKYLGAYVIGTSSAQNKDFVLGLGADEHIDYQSQKFEEKTSNLDFVLDTIGGNYIDRSLKVIKKGGTIISLPSGQNETVSEKANEKGVKGYPILVKSDGDDMKEIAHLLEIGAIKAHVSESFSFDKLAKAHTAVESGRTVGKVVVNL
jgi:NADPH:quinone reductase-like Zn-dependent oxidoreductase